MRQPARSAFRARKVDTARFPAPTSGWVSNQNVSLPEQNVIGALVLDNFFPTAREIILRRGSARYATFENETLPITSLFRYSNGAIERMFAANNNSILDVTTPEGAENIIIGDPVTGDEIGLGADIIGLTSLNESHTMLTGLTGGYWVTTQFATTGGSFLVGVNGINKPFLYDGNRFYQIDENDISLVRIGAATGTFAVGEVITGATSTAKGTILYKDPDFLTIRKTTAANFTSGETVTGGTSGATATTTAAEEVYFIGMTGVDTTLLSFVWSYKSRLLFIERGSMNVWYLDVDAVTGVLKIFPMGGLFPSGGSLMIGAAWSMDSSGDGGLSEQCVFFSTEGEVVVYQGNNPSLADQWSKVGLYKIGRPRGPRSLIRQGGDLLVPNDIGFTPLTQAIQRQTAELAPASVSDPIQDDWSEAVLNRDAQNWEAITWSENQMTVISMPKIVTEPHTAFVANSITGAWARFTGWEIMCMCVFRGRLYFGSSDGRIVQAWATGSDEGKTYTGIYVPLFLDMNTPLQMKFPRMGRVVTKSPYEVLPQVKVQVDYNVRLPAVPNATMVEGVDTWGDAVWSDAKWGVSPEKKIWQRWRPMSGKGYSLAPSVQITSGGNVALDCSVIKTEITFEIGDIVS